MEILSDRIGIVLKYGKIMGSLKKRFFYIDNKGTIYYFDKENLKDELLNMTNINFDDNKIVAHLKNQSKCLNINECSMSGTKIFLEDKFDLKGRSYFEMFLKERDYRSIIFFAIKEEYTNHLYDYISSYREVTKVESEIEFNNFNSNIIEENNYQENNKINLDPVEGSKLSVFSNAKSESYLESVLKKLDGKFKNQNNWEKDCIYILNPSSNMVEYEEAWVELDNGSNYSGPVKNGMPHGYGKEYRPDGSLYTGYFYNGKWHGSGTLTNQVLDSFQGEFIDGCICGI